MNLLEKYKKEILPVLKKKFGYKNDLSVPRLKKIVVNVGVGRMHKEAAFIDNVVANLTKITGQKPILIKAKKSISAFKIREGATSGVAVTLRGARMYDFLDKFLNITLPNVRDFRGINDKHVDNQGNMTIGMKEHLAFPEIKNDDIERTHGLEICFHTGADSKEKGFELFKLLGFPFKKAA